MARQAALLLAVSALLAAGPVGAQVPIDRPGQVETLPADLGPHAVWAADLLLRRSSLVDLDRGAFLGMLSTGLFSATALFPRSRREFYLPETYYSRGSRGERSDVVTLYDPTTLAPTGEVGLPAKRAINVLPVGNAALSDDERFLVVFNMNPATSLSVVDLDRHAFVGEIPTPGCSLVYPAGPRRFLMLCADGSFLALTLDAQGGEGERWRGEPFFDPEVDPLSEKAVRQGDRWLFVSFDGWVHPVDVSGAVPRREEAWSLFDASDRADAWRIGGQQQLALHAGTGRLYALVHRGGPDTHKHAGLEAWVYDVERRARVQRIALVHPGISLLGQAVLGGGGWSWPLDQLIEWLLDTFVPNPGVSCIYVTQDAQPLLVAASQFGGTLTVYDALSGEFARRIVSGNLSTQSIEAHWRGDGRP
jgi:methylamine dehydrogenase heavy chain